MSASLRPDDCCAAPTLVAPLAQPEREALVAVFRALGEPTRLEILRLIAGQPGPLCVCDVVARFPLQQPTISHHLKVLRQAELLTVSRRGVWAYYAADPRGLALVRDARGLLAPEDWCADG